MGPVQGEIDMTRQFLIGLVCAAAAVSSGCGTVANTAYLDPYEGGERVYGGVRVAWDKAANPESRSTWVTAAAYADVPLSAIGDTLTLPYFLALSLAADRRAETPVRMNQLLNKSFISREAVEPVDGWRPAASNNAVTPTKYERLQGNIGP
jgi:uncharacterized protein YceK